MGLEMGSLITTFHTESPWCRFFEYPNLENLNMGRPSNNNILFYSQTLSYLSTACVICAEYMPYLRVLDIILQWR